MAYNLLIPTELAPKLFVLVHPQRGVWRYVFSRAGDARKYALQAQFAPSSDFLPINTARERLTRAAKIPESLL